MASRLLVKVGRLAEIVAVVIDCQVAVDDCRLWDSFGSRLIARIVPDGKDKSIGQYRTANHYLGQVFVEVFVIVIHR
jgi:hypothetical protein